MAASIRRDGQGKAPRIRRDLMDLLSEACPGRHMGVAELKQSVGLAVETLLNCCRDLPASLPIDGRGMPTIPEAQIPACIGSLLSYGVPDLSGFSLLDPRERERLRRSIEKAVARHESRLTNVRVRLDAPGAGDQVLKFHIDAVLEIRPERERVQFDAQLKINSQTYEVNR